MNYQEARSFIDESVRYGGEVGLGKISKLLDYLDHPERELTFIHIAGTNGKGSVLAYVSTILTTAGFRTGRYISPTLYSYEERFQVDGLPITKEAYVSYMELLVDGIRKMERDGYVCPSPFELETVLAFLYFRDMKCDFVVIECGLGGLEDATNVIENTAVAVLTSISMDHMDYLGNSIGEIAANKAGIIKKGAEVVSAYQKKEAMDAIIEAAENHKCNYSIADYREAEVLSTTVEQQCFRYKNQEWKIHLAGTCQIENAVVAIEVIEALNRSEHYIRKTLHVRREFYITKDQIKEGLSNTKWNGRFTVIHKEPYFIVDGAHNPDAAKKFADSMRTYFSEKRKIYIVGMLKDKAYEEVMKLTVPDASYVIAVTPSDNPRALPAKQLANTVCKYMNNYKGSKELGDMSACSDYVITAKSVEEAVYTAFTIADKDDVIASFGSLSFIGQLTSIVERIRKSV